MQPRSREFRASAVDALHRPALQAALKQLGNGFVGGRARARAALPEFESLRERAEQLLDHTLEHLDEYLLEYEQRVIEAGGKVHWASTPEEARQAVLDICREAGARKVIRGKSMIGEEIAINEALEEAGLEVTETDLGEYILQLGGEPPSHIVAPAIHKTKDEISELFHRHHAALGFTERQTERSALVAEARAVLRRKFLEADVGITGANFLVAESGSNIIVTNEGNGDLTQTLAKVHIVTSGIERVVPTLDDATLFLRLLARSATGQETETYTTISTGPKHADDLDGPEEYHVVLVDNGRSKMLAGRFKDMLRCIRCGACMNHCPVYGAVGGHAYGWVYPGPMGSVLTPLIKGLDNAYDLPNACTLNGRCASVCPVKIPLPDLLRELRHMQHQQDITPVMQKRALKLWRYVATRPKLYHALEQIGARVLSGIARKGRIRSLPLAGGWTGSRDLPAPAGRTFMELWQGKRGQK